jgi:drug/metabolite transporter (DMT)-like permease
MFFVPLFAFLFYKKRPSVSLLAGAVLTAVGLYFLCLKGDGGAPFGIGQLLLIGCALVFALHILLVARYEKSDGMALSCVQFSTCALLSLPVALLFESGSFIHIPEAPFPILYAGICSSAIAYTLQIYGQKYTPPALASVLVSTESVIALLSEWACAALGIFGTAFALSVDQCVGCVLAFLGILCAQSLFSFKKKKKASELYRQKTKNARNHTKKAVKNFCFLQPSSYFISSSWVSAPSASYSFTARLLP